MQLELVRVSKSTFLFAAEREKKKQYSSSRNITQHQHGNEQVLVLVGRTK